MSAPNSHTVEIKVRPATLDDRDFVINTARRLAEFGPPPWRSFIEIVTREQQALEEFFDRPAHGTAILIAGRAGEPQLGYAYLETQQDYFTGEPCGHVSTLAVCESGEGQGVGSALVRAAEEWSRSRGFRKLTLNVFDANQRAREVYEHLGFCVETLHYLKILNRG